MTNNQLDEVHVTPAMLDGRWMVRVASGGELTERKHVAQLWQLVQEAVLRK
jgi:aromatic-L-amino-acid decarboxylase